VQTFGNRLLKTKRFGTPYQPNCESRAKIQAGEIAEAGGKPGGGHDKHESQRNLGHGEQLLRVEAGSCIEAAGIGTEGGFEIDARRADCRKESEEHGGKNG
jgi:hypothetical protein